MRIAITSHDFSTVTSHAGRALRFLVLDASIGEEASEPRRLDLALEFAMHGFDDAQPHPLDGVEVLLTGSAGDGLIGHLARRGIRVVCTQETDPKKAVEDYLEGRLHPAAPHDHRDCGCDCGHRSANEVR
jgi:predicted Fe-Mo cluster-binding NifX family protein